MARLGGAVRLAEHLVPRRKRLLKSDPFSALSPWPAGLGVILVQRVLRPFVVPLFGYKVVDAGRPFS